MSHHHHQQQQQQHFFVYLRACSFASSIKNIRLRAVSCWGLCSAHILTLLYCSVFLCVLVCVCVITFNEAVRNRYQCAVMTLYIPTGVFTWERKTALKNRDKTTATDSEGAGRHFNKRRLAKTHHTHTASFYHLLFVIWCARIALFFLCVMMMTMIVSHEKVLSQPSTLCGFSIFSHAVLCARACKRSYVRDLWLKVAQAVC